MDPLTKALLDSVSALGYEVEMTSPNEPDVSLLAFDPRTRETFVVRANDSYAAACTLAQRVGIELEDG